MTAIKIFFLNITKKKKKVRKSLVMVLFFSTVVTSSISKLIAKRISIYLKTFLYLSKLGTVSKQYWLAARDIRDQKTKHTVLTGKRILARPSKK